MKKAKTEADYTKLPFRLIVDILANVYYGFCADFSQHDYTSLFREIYGYFKKDRTRKAFLLCKHVYIPLCVYSKYHVYDRMVFRDLPNKLDHLSIDLPGFLQNQTLPSHLKVLDVGNSCWFTGKNMPKNLSKVFVCNCKHFVGTKIDNLKKLEVEMCEEYTGETINENLEYLWIRYCENFDSSNIPKKLSLLALREVSLKHKDDIQKEIRTLFIDRVDGFTEKCIPDRVYQFGIENMLGLSLLKLEDTGIKIFSMIKCKRIKLKQLPHSVIYMIVMNCSFLDWLGLKKGLKVLTVDNCKSFTGEYLPKSLVYLNVSDCKNFVGNKDVQKIKCVKITGCPKYISN